MGGVCVILSGGGARGALQVATIEQLAPRATAWAGTSVGAIHASAAASGRASVLRPMWEAIHSTSWFMSRELDFWRGLYSLDPVIRRMEDMQALRPVQPLWLGTYDYSAARHRLVRVGDDWTTEAVGQMVRVSSSIPLQHEPARDLWGRWAGDGGVESPLPPVPPGEWDEVHAVLCAPDLPLPLLAEDAVSGPLEQLSRALDCMVAHSVHRGVVALRRYARSHPRTKVRLYEPVAWSEVGATFDADRATLDARLAHGRWMAANPVEIS